MHKLFTSPLFWALVILLTAVAVSEGTKDLLAQVPMP